MGFLTNAFTAPDATPVNHGGGFFGGLFGSGTMANGKSALTLSSYFAAVDIISTDVALMGKSVYKKDGNQRFEYKDHPVNYLISTEPNPSMTAFDFWKVVTLRCINPGNAYVRVVRNASTGAAELFRLLDNVTVVEKDDTLLYYHGGQLLSGNDILHFKGFSLNGKMGCSVIAYAAASIGVSLDAQEYAGDVYKSKGMTYGVITAKEAITNKVIRDAVKDGIRSDFGKLGGVNKVALLDDGMEYKSLTVTPAEAQFLETNKNGVLEVCRWLNIAPHKLKNLDNANYSNIYQQSTEHVQYTLMRWVKPQELECNRKLFSTKERGSVYIKSNQNELLRGDLDMKQKYYTAAIYAGYMNRNEVRAMEDMNPVDGLDDYLQPTNMQTLEAMMENLKTLQAETLKSE